MQTDQEFCKYLNNGASIGTASREGKLLCEESLQRQYRRFPICSWDQVAAGPFKRGLLFEGSVLGSAPCRLGIECS